MVSFDLYEANVYISVYNYINLLAKESAFLFAKPYFKMNLCEYNLSPMDSTHLPFW